LDILAEHDTKDAVVRVQVQMKPEQEGLVRDAEVRRVLKDSYYIAGISLDVEREYRQRLGIESPEELTPAELLARYLDSKQVAPDRIKDLLQYAQEIIEPPT
jgi:exonuclease SbcD